MKLLLEKGVGRLSKCPDQARSPSKNKAPEGLGDPSRQIPGPHLQRSEMGSRICFSNKFPQHEDNAEERGNYYKMHTIIY